MADKYLFPIFGLGVVAGVVSLSFGVALMSNGRFTLLPAMPSSDVATLLSGFGGAALGGVISWMLSKQAASETLKRDNERREAEDKATALGVSLKVQQITNGYYTQQKYIYDTRIAANEMRMIDRPIWEMVKPAIGNSFERPSFQASDFVPLLAAGRPDLIDRCSMLALRYDVMEQSFQSYSDRRHAIQQWLAPFTKFTDQTGKAETVIPEGMRSEFLVRQQELEDLIGQILRFINVDFEESKKLCAEISEVFRIRFGNSIFELQIPASTENSFTEN